MTASNEGVQFSFARYPYTGTPLPIRVRAESTFYYFGIYFRVGIRVSPPFSNSGAPVWIFPLYFNEDRGPIFLYNIKIIYTCLLLFSTAMPSLNIATNLKRDQIPGDFLEKATNLLASELGKPASVSILFKLHNTVRLRRP